MVTRSDFNKYILPVYNPAGFIPKKAKGSYLWDQNGKKFIDFATGIAVSNLGHCHPRLIKALNDQSKSIWHLSNVLVNQPALKLAKLLCQKTFAEKVFFTNSGAEAVEAAIKTARKYSTSNFSKSKNEIIAFNDAFHGRTMMAIALNGSKRMTDGFGPMPKSIKHHEFNKIDGLESKFSNNTSAVILELVQGEAGIIPAKKKFVSAIVKLCKKNNALLIIDEVQPDILCSAKGMGNGIPIGAMLTTDKVAQNMIVGMHGSTYGGNPLACAVSKEVFEIISKQSFLKDVLKKEKLFLSLLNEMNEKVAVFSEIRSSGLWFGLKIDDTSKLTLANLMQASYKEGLMILKANNNTVRLAPSLNISKDDIERGVKKLEKAILSLV